jgi:hypothetical protein
MLLWVSGLLLNVFGSIIVNLAANLLKLAHNEEENENFVLQLSDEENKGTMDYSFYGFRLLASQLYWRIGTRKV